MAMEQKHFQGCISNWKWSCHCHLVLSDCILQKAEKVGPITTLSTLDSLFFFVTPFFPKKKLGFIQLPMNFWVKERQLHPMLRHNVQEPLNRPVGTTRHRRRGRPHRGWHRWVHSPGGRLIGLAPHRRPWARGEGHGGCVTSHQSWMVEDLSIQKSSCCRFVVFFKHMQEILSS